MTILSAQSQPPQSLEIVYPSSDGEPLAETYVHLVAIITIFSILKQYLNTESSRFSRSPDHPGTVLSNQFLYYAQGYPRLRVAPDVMVVFDVLPGGREHYKLWEEGEVPAIIFEVTSKGTQDEDQTFKKLLYEQLGVREYWQFDPKGEWIAEHLLGYRHDGERYQVVGDRRSEVLQLRLVVEDGLLRFYREDTGEKLLTPDELSEANQALLKANQTLTATQQTIETENARLRTKLLELGIRPEDL